MGLQAAELFGKMKPHMEKHGAGIVAQIKSVYAFEIREKKGGPATTWTIDLKTGSGSIHEGKPEGIKADATFVMLDADFVQLANGKLQPQAAFMGVSTFKYELSKLYLTIGQNEDQRKHEGCSQVQARNPPKGRQALKELRIS